MGLACSGKQHAAAIAGAGGTVVLADISPERVEVAASEHARQFTTPVWGAQVDITNHREICSFGEQVLDKFGRIDILINNAANNPKMDGGA